jgi:soluble lytic murein transglycosylase-like protein
MMGGTHFITPGEKRETPARDRLFMIRMVIVLMTALMPFFQANAADMYAFIGEGGETLYTNIRAPGARKVRFPLARAVKKHSKGSAGIDTQRVSYDPAIFQASELFAVDPDLVRSVIKVESNYNHRAVSPKGALGLMQLMPGTAREMGVADPFDPAANIHGGVMYLRRMLDALEGDLPLSLAAYNAGLERVIAKKEIPAIRETRNYVKQVLNYYSKLKGY